MNLKLRWIVIIIVIASALISMFPLGQKLKLGLDLQGGMHVILGVETEKAVEARVESIVNRLRKELSTEKIDFEYVQEGTGYTVNVSLKDSKDADAVKKIVDDNYYELKSAAPAGTNVLSFVISADAQKRIKDYAVEQSLEVVRNRIDEFGVSEPLIQRQGKENIVVQLPGVTDPDRAIGLIGKTAQLKLYLVDDKVSPDEAASGNVPFDDIVLYKTVRDDITNKIISKQAYALKREAVLTGDSIIDADVNFSNQTNTPIVSFQLDAAGSKIFAEVTGDNIGKRLAIVLDGNINSAPVINSRIGGGSAIIEGIDTLEEAKDTAIVLRAGSLPAPVKIEENRTVGPSLGQDSIDKGFKAALIGLVLIIIFMLVYYKMSGLLANIALILNFILILGVMSGLNATLTLPGIAGIILTIGMSVDANVLIFERVREELRQGRTPLNALELGYEKALSTILDANITTIIAAIVLFQFGTGPIKGFAVTLSIGILASLFTAIFVTKTIFASTLKRKEVKKLSI